MIIPNNCPGHVREAAAAAATLIGPASCRRRRWDASFNVIWDSLIFRLRNCQQTELDKLDSVAEEISIHDFHTTSEFRSLLRAVRCAHLSSVRRDSTFPLYRSTDFPFQQCIVRHARSL